MSVCVQVASGLVVVRPCLHLAGGIRFLVPKKFIVRLCLHCAASIRLLVPKKVYSATVSALCCVDSALGTEKVEAFKCKCVGVSVECSSKLPTLIPDRCSPFVGEYLMLVVT